MTAERVRPSGVPAEAWWSPSDNEWVLGAKDAEGRLHGEVTYWRPDGSLVCKCDHVAGKPHGVSRRFHESGEVSQHCYFEDGKLHGVRSWFMTDAATTERPRATGLNERVWRGELDYVRGAIVGFRYYDRAGNPVGTNGEPLPARPPNVPSDANRNNAGRWVQGRWGEDGKPAGPRRFWSADGALETEEHHEGGEVRVTHFHPDGARRVWYALRDEELVGEAAAWRRDGTPRVRATFGERTTIEHLAADGAVVRAATYDPAPEASTAPADLSEDEALALLHLEDDEAEAIDPAMTWSPAGLGRVIGLGWGGDDDRDAAAARAARGVALKVAPASLAERLVALKLDRAPRLQTPQRVAAVVRELAADPAVDGDVLRNEFIFAGGPGGLLALSDPKLAPTYLRSRCPNDTLQLADLGLTELPPCLGRFHDVARLYAEGNRLTTVPSEVGDMFQLAWLNLARNRIQSLPATLAWLPSLRTLYLSDNALTSIPSTVFELQELCDLALGDNQLTELPEAIGDLPCLRQLWLTGSPLPSLPASLSKLPLRFLHLGGHAWEEPPEVLGDCVHLETLWIASRALKRLPAAICKLPRLRELILWYSSVTELPEELYEMKQLTELRIKHNPLPDSVYARLAEALPSTRIS